MKVRITSKGTAESTRVVNAETGEELKGVTGISLTAGVGGLPVATITMVGVPFDVVAEANVITSAVAKPYVKEAL